MEQKNRRGQNPRSRANLRPFRGGVSGNPGGRPKGFTACLKERCGDDYERVADGLYFIAFGTATERRKFFGEPVTVTTRERLTAIIELRDSGPERPAQTIARDEHPAVPAFMLPPGTRGVMPF
jgi:hypothetical protein